MKGSGKITSQPFLLLLFLAFAKCVFSQTAPVARPIAPSGETRPFSSPTSAVSNSSAGRIVLQPPVAVWPTPIFLGVGKIDPPKTKEENPKGQKELSLEEVVEQVVARNPSLAQMVAAWQAASARYPQVSSLDDPMFSAMLAPASFGSNTVDAGYRLEVSQKFLFPGKLRLRGQSALAEASAAANDVEDMRVQLIEAAKLAFFDYYLVDRGLSVNDESLRLLKDFRESALARFKTGAPQQDVLQAEVEIGRQRERRLLLDRMRQVAVARINTLMNLPPDAPLGDPPPKLKAVPGLPPVETLRTYALAQRPDLKALGDRLAADQTALALAYREYYPDLEAAAAYDSIMGNGAMRDLAPQIGLRLNIPLRLGRRNAAVSEAQARIVQRRAELASRTNQIHFQVQEAYEQLVESEKVLALYNQTILPAARANVKAAQAAYATGKAPQIPFLSLIEAQRNFVNLSERYYEATADYFRRLATLERVIGGPVSFGEVLPLPGPPK